MGCFGCGFGVCCKVSDQSTLKIHKLLKKSTITLIRFVFKAY